MNARLLLPALIGALVLAWLTGCTSVPESLQEPIPDYVPTNYGGVATFPTGLRRVLLLPSAGANVAPPESTAQLDPVFISALQRQQRFEVVTLDRNESRRSYGAQEFLSTAALPAGLLNRLAKDFAADAVLFVDITSFRAHRPLELGIRSKLVMLQSREIIWSFDEIFSLADPRIDASARRHAKTSRTPVPVNLSANLSQSPTAFAAYVAETVFTTLPPR
jgi:hypothetical protein